MRWRSLSVVLLLLVAQFLTPALLNGQNSHKNKVAKTNNIKEKEAMNTNNKIIVDVRTPQEFQYDGHADCSVNYPLDIIQNKTEELKKYEKVILVCRSGARAESGKRLLQSAGIKNVENLGPWQNVTCGHK